MGRIISSVTISNYLEPDKTIRCDALVGTGASHMILPLAWKDRLGKLPRSRTIKIETADQRESNAEICGPVEVELEGFRPVSTEVMFMDMKPADGNFEPLIGYLILVACPAAVDMPGHRLVPVKHLDAK